MTTGYTPVPRTKQRIGGLLIAVVGTGLAVMAWRQAHAEGSFSFRAALIGPACVVLGLALVVWPGYKEERLARGEDISQLQGTQLLTARWWGVLVAALVVAGAYAFALRRGM